MMRMIGGVFGVATLTALFQHLAAGRAASGHAPADIFIYSLSHSLLFSAAIAIVGSIVAAVFIRSHHAEEDEPAQTAQAEPALDVA
jgi:hypothetical protein